MDFKNIKICLGWGREDQIELFEPLKIKEMKIKTRYPFTKLISKSKHCLWAGNQCIPFDIAIPLLGIIPQNYAHRYVERRMTEAGKLLFYLYHGIKEPAVF